MAMAAASAFKSSFSLHPLYSSSSSSSLPDTSDAKLSALPRPPLALRFPAIPTSFKHLPKLHRLPFRCNAGDVSVSEPSVDSPAPPPVVNEEDDSWVPVIPITALPRGERRLVRQDGEDVLLLWYKNEVYAIENTSPAEGAYSEGFVNARLTQDGCIVCPSTDSTFDLKTGEIKDWLPTNPVLRLLTPPLRSLVTYPVKADSEYIYISMKTSRTGESAEIVFGGNVQAGKGPANVEVDEVRMVVDEDDVGFGFTPDNEITNGRAAMVGFTVLLVFELLTGKGFLKGIGFLDFLYRYLQDFPILKY